MNLNLFLRVPSEPTRLASLPLSSNTGWTKNWRRFKESTSKDLLGVHNYINLQNGIYEGELSINNGVIPFDGKLYFTDITANLDDPTYEIRTLPYPNSQIVGRAWSIINPLVSGNNIFLPKWYLKRRYVICKVGTPVELTDSILKYNSTTIPSSVTNYGPFNMTQPVTDRIDENQRCTLNNNSLLNALNTGAAIYLTGIADVEFGAFGGWMPNGSIYGGAPAGDGIYPYTGFEQCPAAILQHRIMYNLNWDRMPIACYNLDGTPVRLEQWATFNDSIPQIMKGEPTKQGQTELIAFLDGDYNTYHYKIYNPDLNGTCSYENGLWQFAAYDIAHLRRCSHNGEVVYEYTKNPMIAEDMDMVTEYIRQFGWGNRSDSKVIPNYPGDFIPHTLKSMLYDVQTNPGQGAFVDRAYGWAMYHHALLKHINPDNNLVLSWMQDAITLFGLAADSHGIVQRDYHPPYMPPNVNGTQSFHTSIIALGAIAVARIIRGPSTRTVLLNLCNNLYNLLGTKPYEYAPAEVGPPHWLWTYENGNYIDPLDVNLGDVNGDPTHVLAVLAETSRFVGSRLPLSYSLKQWVPDTSFAARKVRLDGVPWSQKNQTAGMQSIIDSLNL
jgi:hypothetical protein